MSRHFPPDAGTLDFVTPAGRTVSYQAKFGPDTAVPGSGFVTRSVVLGQGWTLDQRRLKGTAAGAAARDLLDTEIGAGVVLARRYGEAGYPDGLPRLAGFGIDGEEPFVLYEPVPGRAASEEAGRLGVGQLNHFGRSLFRALRLLSAAGLVHRGISPRSVLWDGSVARLADLSTVGFAGQARRRVGVAPWASAEQCLGQGIVDPRDDVWSAAKLVVYMSTGPDGHLGSTLISRGAPLDPNLARLLEGALNDRAAGRPEALDLLRRSRGTDPLGEAGLEPDPLQEGRRAIDALLGRKPEPLTPVEPVRSRWRLPGRRPVAKDPSLVQCPQCLDWIRFDPGELYTRDAKQAYEKLTLTVSWNDTVREDVIRGAYQKCTNSGGARDHYLPTTYLTHGQPLTIAMVGRSAAGKTHLLAAMAGEIEAGALAPYGISHRAANAEEHNTFIRTHVSPLRAGQLLPRTPESSFPVLEDVVLLSKGGVERPVAFFDISGENLVRSDATTRFLTGIDALIFVVDPVRAFRLPVVEQQRRRLGVPAADAGDPTFGTVLGRLPRVSGFVDVPAAVAIAKSDLIRHEPPVARWLGDQVEPGERAPASPAETRDALAFLSAHADDAWLRPAIDCHRLAAHFVTATGTGARGTGASGNGAGGSGNRPGFGTGVRARRVLEPLLSIFAMCGLLDEPPAGPTFRRHGGG
jgi:hypothetical protein